MNDVSNSAKRTLATAAILLALAPSGQPLDAQQAISEIRTTDTIQSAVLGETRRLSISLPVDYDAPEYATEAYPVLIFLDSGPVSFVAHAANARWLAQGSAPIIPRLIVVGVATPESSRFRDMTLALPGAPEGAGGALAFLRFLRTELRPYIAAKYRTNSVTVLVGHSMTGLFSAWAFGAAPDFLTGAIALSPSFPIWDGAAGKAAIQAIETRTTPGRLFVASGTSENMFPALDPMVESLAARLKSKPIAGREFQYERIPDASHGNTPGLGMLSALRFIFRPVSLAGHKLEELGTEAGVAALTQAFDSIREQYVRGARQLGFLPRLPLAFLQGSWSRIASPEFAPFVLHVCEDLIAGYPNLWNGFECAGDALGRMGRADDATANYRRGTAVAQAAGDAAAATRLQRKAEKREH
jgi:predicted alpha/beta superfamily hydrolase